MTKYKIEEIDGVKVLFLDNDKNIKETLDSFEKDEIGLIVIGTHEDFIDRLQGKKLSEFIIEPTNNKIDIINLPPPQREPFEIKPLDLIPQFENPLIGFEDRGWKGEKKWYDQYNKRNRKNKR